MAGKPGKSLIDFAEALCNGYFEGSLQPQGIIFLKMSARPKNVAQCTKAETIGNRLQTSSVGDINLTPFAKRDVLSPADIFMEIKHAER
ncbi:hypothetical protein AWM79_22390 [Pseudomonas agarici]|uniref:Uncharacterized protein n=2 Tax=Pseudomonas agarici TaxID=46677 RepID=A0A0X1T6Z0_PSEAA|nr:hypothetical protein AWM79_22390 [Pseudomonas agarici]